MNIAGKKAIVLGGTSGIGLETSLMLVEKGASVVAVSRDPSKAGEVPAGIRLDGTLNPANRPTSSRSKEEVFGPWRF